MKIIFPWDEKIPWDKKSQKDPIFVPSRCPTNSRPGPIPSHEPPSRPIPSHKNNYFTVPVPSHPTGMGWDLSHPIYIPALMVQDIIHSESDIDRVKSALAKRGADCIQNMKCCREKAANQARKFIPDSACILTHGHSRAVIAVLRVRF